MDFKNREEYEAAVRKLLIENDDALKFVRSLFGSLPADVAAT